MGFLAALRRRVVETTTGLFAHAPYPLDAGDTYAGDPGLFGAASVTWPVLGDAASFVGGVRALLVQAAHPEVAAGVAQHSRYREDPLGRLSRTSAYVTATAFGARPEVERAVKTVKAAHRRVAGMSDRDRPYSADDPELAAWVHNALTDSFLEAYVRYGPRPLDSDERDRFVAEQALIGNMLGADPVPESADGLRRWIADHPQVAPSDGMEDAISFLRTPPLPLLVRTSYRLLFIAAAATLPVRIRRTIGVRRYPGAVVVGRLTVGLLRWFLGASPSWHLALLRSGAPVPPGVFRQTAPAADRTRSPVQERPTSSASRMA